MMAVNLAKFEERFRDTNNRYSVIRDVDLDYLIYRIKRVEEFKEHLLNALNEIDFEDHDQVKIFVKTLTDAIKTL